MSFVQVSYVFGESLKQEKGEHFIIQYPSTQSVSWAQEILHRAERYYETIASQIGYQRYDEFWTWEQRVEITIYPNQKIFLEKTGKRPN